MKKLWIAFIIALLALAFVATPTLASDGGASADVDCDEPGVDNEDPNVGDTVLFYGTVHYDISAHNNGDYWDHCWHGRIYETGAYVILNASGYYFVLDPDSNPVAEDDFDWSTGYIMGDTGWDCNYWGCWPDDEDVSYSVYGDWNWSVPVLLDTAGDYTVEHGGEASAEYGHWVQWYKWSWYYYDWVPDGDPIFYAEGDPAYDSCSAQRTVTAHSGAGLGMIARPPRLTIQLPAGLVVERPLHAEHFFPSDGWGDPTTEYIVYSDGIWQVEIADGTIIQLDGEWHKYTWVEVDDQGNVICRYGSDGHIIAEEVALSSPITVTKVG